MPPRSRGIPPVCRQERVSERRNPQDRRITGVPATDGTLAVRLVRREPSSAPWRATRVPRRRYSGLPRRSVLPARSFPRSSRTLLPPELQRGAGPGAPSSPRSRPARRREDHRAVDPVLRENCQPLRAGGAGTNALGMTVWKGHEQMCTPHGSQRARFLSETVRMTCTGIPAGHRSRPRAIRHQAIPRPRPAASSEEGGHGQVRRLPLPRMVRRRRRFREAMRPDGPGRAACSTRSRNTVRSDYRSSRRGVGAEVRTRIQSGETAHPAWCHRRVTMPGDSGPRQARASIPIRSIR